MGFGYHKITFENDTEPSGFGYFGLRGSIGFHHKTSGISVGVMLNKADSDKIHVTSIFLAVANHFKW
jgi:hypothetical protein